jgi:hypothetical protein
MKNIDLNSLTKAELIQGIINLTNKYNECIKSRGFLNIHKVPSANTLRTKSREVVEESFTHAWDWLREEIRAYYNVLDVEVDKSAIDDLKARIEKDVEENYKAYRAGTDSGIAEITELIHNYIINCGILNVFPDINLEDVAIVSVSDECVNIKLKKCFGGEINYYHRNSRLSSITDNETKKIDEINFGTIGAFDLDSERGRQQLFLMNLLSHIGCNQEIRTKMNGILEGLRDMNLTRIRTNHKLQDSMVDGIDEIVAPYINSVATGEFLWKPSKTE